MAGTDASTSVAGVTVTAGPLGPDTVTLIAGGVQMTGWTDVRVTRRAEGIPNDFEVGLTTLNPTDGSQVVAYAGQSCQVKVGKDTVITGYIDRDTNGGDAESHRLSIVGRGKCADLVDCSAEWKGGQISGSSAMQIAAKLAEPYDIAVNAGPGLDIESPIPQFNLNYGETAQEIIDRICTYSGLLYYEDEQGDLLLAQVGASIAASGFGYGVNVQRWTVENGMDQRFSDYVCAQLSTSIFGDESNASLLYFTASDPNVARHRLMYLVAESAAGSLQLCELRALWEASRRAGRGTKVTLTTDSWRDQGGTLWAPNTLVPVTLPGLRQGPNYMMCISEVTLRIAEDGGTVADLTLLPPAAFQPQPIVIQPTYYSTSEANTASGTT